MPFSAIPLKYDPYRKFKFLVKLDNVIVMAVHKVSSITKSVEPIEWRTGGDSNFSAKVPGITKWEAITLERGLSADTAFQEWMIKVNKYTKAGGQSDEAVHDFRKNLTIEMYDLQNELVMTVNVYNAWPSKLTIADFDAKANELAIEHIELQHEGWDLTPGSAPGNERPAA